MDRTFSVLSARWLILFIPVNHEVPLPPLYLSPKVFETGDLDLDLCQPWLNAEARLWSRASVFVSGLIVSRVSRAGLEMKARPAALRARRGTA